MKTRSSQRFDDWPQRLEAALNHWSLKEFVWGESDCFCFAAAMVEAMTGNDPMAGLRDQYHDRESAYALLNNRIFMPGSQEVVILSGHRNAIETVMGEPQSVRLAQRGDLILYQFGNGDKLIGVVDGSGRKAAAMAEEKGLVRLMVKLGSASWRV